MKRMLASLALITAVAGLSGCYYDPGYSYVRSSSYGGDAYYGEGSNSYYATPGYYGGYYGDYYGWRSSPGVSINYYSGPRYRYYRGGGYRGHGDYRGYYDGYRGHGGYRGGRSDQGHGGRGSGRPVHGGRDGGSRGGSSHRNGRDHRP